MPSTPKHPWRFFRAGGVDQVVIDRGVDIAHLEELDLKLWIALAMPVKGTVLDPRTAAILDADKDGRIRAAEILDAAKWLRERVAPLDVLFEARSEVDFARLIHDELRSTAERVARELRPDATSITLADVKEAEKRFAATRFNGDGVVTLDAAIEAPLQQVIGEIIATYGAVPDRSGQPGVDADKLKAFFEDVLALVKWQEEGLADAALRPLGDATEDGAALLRRLRPKLDDYFTRCRLAAFDARAAAAAQGTDAELAALHGKDLAVGSPELARYPLARVAGGQPLAFSGGVNPAYLDDLKALGEKVARPLLGNDCSALTEAGFAKLVEAFAAHEAWRSRKPASKVDALPLSRLKEIATGTSRDQLTELAARDFAQKGEYERIEAVDKLVRLARDFTLVLRNFVNFSDFYARKGALFQVGTLFLDRRGCALCLEVNDAGKHAALAGLSSTYLAYCECSRANLPKRTVVASFTTGDSDNLMVGRNGVFYDREGLDWDATITKVVENPISIRQAFFSPYKKFVRLVEEQVNKRASAADADANAKLASTATATAHADRAVPPPVKEPPPGVDVGTVAAIGVAVGGIGAMVTGLLSAFFGLGLWMPLGVISIILLISCPSMLMAWLKLRRRNLGPLLDAGGWAVNGMASINVPFGAALTGLATVPASAERLLFDPYAVKKNAWVKYAVLALLLAAFLGWASGLADPYLPEGMRSAILHSKAAPVPPPPAPPAVK